MTLVLCALAVALLLWSLFSAKLAATPLTAPMFFTGVGLLLGAYGPAHADLEAQQDWVHLLAEITLVLVLFTDASRIDIRSLWREHDLPGRLLGFGLPLTILLGAAAAWLVLPELGAWGALLVAAILAPTDAALGQAVVTNPGVPARIRQTLNVESGLNDGLALPVVLVALCAVAGAEAESTGEGGAVQWVEFAALQVTLGPICGVLVGWLGGRSVDLAARKDWITEEFLELSAIGLAVLAYAGSEAVGGNGFIAAFVAGTTFGSTVRDRCASLLSFGEAQGQLLALLTFAAFGALIAPLALEDLDVAVVGYALLSLTLIRGLPVAAVLRGRQLDRSTTLFLAWFGPRGIASILYVLLVLERATSPAADRITSVVAVTVLLSVVLHGMTAAPCAAWYARIQARHANPIPESTDD